MYPSSDDAYFGVFVKNFCESLTIEDGVDIIAKSLIKGQGKNLFIKMLKYFSFYISILYKGFFKSYDVVYVHNVSHSVLPIYFLLIKKAFKNFKLVLNPHGEDMIVTHKLDGILLKLSLPLIRKADQLVCPSLFYSEEIVIRYGLNPKKIFVSASGGINLELFKPITPQSLKSREYKIGYVSRLSSQKGWDTLLLAVSQLIKEKEFQNLKVIVVGKGESEDLFLEMIKSLNLNDNIEYLGFKAQKDLPKVFNSLDAFIFPTKMLESLGLVGLEAMACGIPVIGVDRGGIGDYLINDYNGLKFVSEDPISLATQIKKFFSLNSEKRLELKKNALTMADKFSRENIKNQMVQNLATLVSK